MPTTSSYAGAIAPGRQARNGPRAGWLRAAAGLVLAAAVAGCSAGRAAPAAPTATSGSSSGSSPVRTYGDLSHDHVLEDVSYPQSPPVGGRHWPPQTQDGYGWQQCGVYPEPVVEEFAVHSLEHGAVWLTYLPGAAPADVAALAALVAVLPDYVLVSPVPGQPQPFMATAWGLQLGVTSATDPALRAFTATYAGQGQGGEKGADCAHGSTLEQARRALSRLAAGS